MVNIGILTEQNGFNRGSCDFYPLIKWKNELKEDGFNISYIKSHKNKDIFNNDVVIIDHRYYRRLIVLEKVYKDKRFVIELINKLKNKGIKVILFDNGDGAGGRQWDLIEYVDVLVKKQVLKNKFFYTKNCGVASFMIFVNEYDLSEERKLANQIIKENYTPCPAEQLHKIKVGWNIGMLDYRYFPLQKYFPFGTNRILNSIYKVPSFNTEFDKKDINTAFRGKVREDNLNYSFQRNKVIRYLKDKDDEKFVTGDIIPKKEYLEELQRSKTCVSPFGWGEVCYRDFEAIIAGAVLIKPDMSHIDTYPDIYIKNQTYIPLEWDLSDLEEKINLVIENYDYYKQYIYNAQEIFKRALEDYQTFKKRFQFLIS